MGIVVTDIDFPSMSLLESRSAIEVRVPYCGDCATALRNVTDAFARYFESRGGWDARVQITGDHELVGVRNTASVRKSGLHWPGVVSLRTGVSYNGSGREPYVVLSTEPEGLESETLRAFAKDFPVKCIN